MASVTINGTARSEFGKRTAKAARYADSIPVVMYGPGEVHHFTALSSDFRHLIYTPDFKIAEVNLDGQVYKCILKDKQFHPVSDKLMHVDLLMMKEGHPLKLNVPLRLTGSSPGVKVGGKLMQSVRTIKIKCTPENLVDQLVVDVSTLELGQSIRVRNIESAAGVEIMMNGGIPVAMVEVPRALRGKQAQG